MLLSACLHRIDHRVEALPDITSDRGYANIYRSATRTSRVYRGLEHQFSVNATHLSTAFLQAFRDRHRLLTDNHDDIFGNNARLQTAFLVSLATPIPSDLRDYLTWTVQLRKGEKSTDPISIRKIRNKNKLELFFRNVTPWSSEYLLVFDPPSHQQTNPLQLVVGNSRARVRLSWVDAD